MFPGSCAWPLTHDNVVDTFCASLSPILAKIPLIRSWFNTSTPFALFHPFLAQFLDHTETQLIE